MKKGVVFLILAAQFSYAFISVAPPDKFAPKVLAAYRMVQPFAMIELFTSEGCSNCPPAYAVVDQIVKTHKQNHEQVFLLDFHVDYFNVPWVDPYSSPQNTERQQSYGRVFPDAGVYTPQMIVNGNTPLLGSDAGGADSAVDNALKTEPLAKISISNASIGKEGSVEITFATQNIPPDSMINIALIQKTVMQKVLKGENAGKTLTHHDVVRYMVTSRVKDGFARIAIPKKLKVNDSDFSVVAFRQNLNTMKIVAAAERDVEANQSAF